MITRNKYQNEFIRQKWNIRKKKKFLLCQTNFRNILFWPGVILSHTINKVAILVLKFQSLCVYEEDFSRLILVIFNQTNDSKITYHTIQKHVVKNEKTSTTCPLLQNNMPLLVLIDIWNNKWHVVFATFFWIVRHAVARSSSLFSICHITTVTHLSLI